MNTIKNIRTGTSRIVICFLVGLLTFSCDYLNIIPDNTPTIDHAFTNRNEAQRYLYGLLGGMPDVGNFGADPALAGSDEVWMLEEAWAYNRILTRLLKSGQNTLDPLVNYWSSAQDGRPTLGGKTLWTTIADCNLFMENIHKPYDLTEWERDKWIGEALFVKAYCHFWLFRQYGPIPLIKDNLPIDTETVDIMRYREPVDDVVDFIVSLLDQAMELLPLRLENETEEMGRPDKCIAAALKAQTLALAASPLYNCNPDYADYIDKRGKQLFPQDKSAERAKWQRAAEACKDAIEMAHEGRHRLYDAYTDFQNANLLSEETVLSIQVKGAVTERWNDEIIWGNSTLSNSILQRFCCAIFDPLQIHGAHGFQNWSPSLCMVEQFYTKNGIPIEDDAEWTGKDLWAMRTATAADRQYIREDEQSIELHFDREARFYGSIFFHNGTWFGNQATEDNTNNPGHLYVGDFRQGRLNGYGNSGRTPYTGYLLKKLVHHRTGAIGGATFNIYNYAFPIIRLADLYLLYAETLNESLDAPNEEVYEYIDAVRARTGLRGVVMSWVNYAVAEKKNLPFSKEGMRDIIQRERMNELAFEGPRYWDIRRWKLAEDYLNRPIKGLFLWAETSEELHVETQYLDLKFEKKDYFTPIRTDVLVTNSHLLQSPYWNTFSY